MTSAAKEVLAEHVGVSEDDCADHRAHKLYRFQRQVPGPLWCGQSPDPNGALVRSFSCRPRLDDPLIIPLGDGLSEAR